MKAFITLSALLGVSQAGLIKTIQQSGPLAGPVHAAFGDLVQTQNGLRSISLEGFSEDVNQDGFVDPVAQAVPVVHVPVHYTAPLVHAAPAVHTYAAPHAVHYAAPATYVHHAAPVVHTVASPAVHTYTTHNVHPVASHITSYSHPVFAHQVIPGVHAAPVAVVAKEEKVEVAAE